MIVGTLGFPITMVLTFLWFVNNKAWPWFTGFMRDYTSVIDKNTMVMSTLLERMDQQHQQLSKQLANSKAEIVAHIERDTG